jgi:hypothetical protein
MPRSCPQCQTETSDDAAFCPQCGATIPQSFGITAEASAAPAGPPPSTYSYAATPAPGTAVYSGAFKFDATRLSSADRITGIASFVLLITLFLPWYGAFGFSPDGLSWHGYLYIVLLVTIAILVYLGARAGLGTLAINKSLAHAPVLLVATLVNFVLVFLAFLFKPSGFSWQYGAFLSLIAAIVAAAPIAVPALRSAQASRK